MEENKNAKCKLHKNNDAVANCIKCGNTYCEVCRDLTGDSGFCLSCEIMRTKAKARYTAEKMTTYLANALAGIVAAVLFWVARFWFDEAGTLGTIATIITAVYGLAAAFFFADALVKNKKAKKTLKNLEQALHCAAENNDFTNDAS